MKLVLIFATLSSLFPSTDIQSANCSVYKNTYVANKTKYITIGNCVLEKEFFIGGLVENDVISADDEVSDIVFFKKNFWDIFSWHDFSVTISLHNRDEGIHVQCLLGHFDEDIILFKECDTSGSEFFLTHEELALWAYSPRKRKSFLRIHNH